MSPISGRLCAICGERTLSAQNDVRCGGCRMSAPPFIRAAAGAERVFVATVARVLKAEATWALPEDIEETRTLAAYA